MKTIAIVAQKGGTGKTTTSAALSAGLTRAGKRALAIDLDAQCNLSFIMRADTKHITAKQVLEGTAPAAQAIQQTPAGAIVAASPLLSIANIPMTANARLRAALEAVAGMYDYCVIDCPPSLGVLTINALTAADFVIVPTMPDALSLQGVTALMQTVETVKAKGNPSLQVMGLLLTRYSSRALINRAGERQAEATAARNGTKVFKSRIRESVAIREAQTMQTDIFTYAPKSAASADYSALISEIEGEC